MEKLNQLFFIIFALFLFGIYLSTVKKTDNDRHRYVSGYWPASILTRAAAFLIWAISPILGSWTLVFSNTLYIVSLITLLFTLRSWRVEITVALKFLAFVSVVVYVITYVYIWHHSEGFLYRAYLLAFFLLVISGLEIRELIKNVRQDKSPLLKLILILACLQFVLAIVALNMISNDSNRTAKSILQNSAEGMIGFWLTFGMHLIFYGFVNSFLYQKLWESEKLAHEQLIAGRLKLTKVIKEKDEVAELLKERDQLLSKLLRVNKTVATGALSASIAHEINQPLTSIQMNVQLLRELMNLDAEKVDLKLQSQLVDEILKNNERASGIIKSLRGIFSEATHDFERVDIVHIINSVLDLSNSELQRQKINIEINVPEVVYANVYPQEVLQVVLNILNNAIISLASLEQEEKKISISLSENNDQVLICIEDNGPGVPKDLEKKLFDLLANVKGAGMGLGLWLCKYVIARHEGKIWYEQAEQGGAKFCIKFPANLVSYKIRS